jgi:hypothetical protein
MNPKKETILTEIECSYYLQLIKNSPCFDDLSHAKMKAESTI